jgi:hypothetical protein
VRSGCRPSRPTWKTPPPCCSELQLSCSEGGPVAAAPAALSSPSGCLQRRVAAHRPACFIALYIALLAAALRRFAGAAATGDDCLPAAAAAAHGAALSCPTPAAQRRSAALLCPASVSLPVSFPSQAGSNKVSEQKKCREMQGSVSTTKCRVTKYWGGCSLPCQSWLASC